MGPSPDALPSCSPHMHPTRLSWAFRRQPSPRASLVVPGEDFLTALAAIASAPASGHVAPSGSSAGRAVSFLVPPATCGQRLPVFSFCPAEPGPGSVFRVTKTSTDKGPGHRLRVRDRVIHAWEVDGSKWRRGLSGSGGSRAHRGPECGHPSRGFNGVVWSPAPRWLRRLPPSPPWGTGASSLPAFRHQFTVYFQTYYRVHPLACAKQLCRTPGGALVWDPPLQPPDAWTRKSAGAI